MMEVMTEQFQQNECYELVIQLLNEHDLVLMTSEGWRK